MTDSVSVGVNGSAAAAAAPDDALERLKAALAALAINSLPGRGLSQRLEERHRIESFLEQRFGATQTTPAVYTGTPPVDTPAMTAGSLYVCGPVGTGKTVLVKDVVTSFSSCGRSVASSTPFYANASTNDNKFSYGPGGDMSTFGRFSQRSPKRIRVVDEPQWLDCVADSNAESVESVYVWLAARLAHTSRASIRKRGLTTGRLRLLISRLVKKPRSGGPLIVVMDEMDDLLDLRGGTDLLVQLCKWASVQGSQFVLIGIGNNMQLVDAMASDYAAAIQRRQRHAHIQGQPSFNVPMKRPEYLPSVLRFGAYGQEDIGAILCDKVGNLGVFVPGALQLIAMRAESMGGDLRVAMTMCREPLLRAYMENARTGKPIQLPLQLPFVAPIVAELVDDTRSIISGLTTLQKQFLAALFVACTESAASASSSSGTTVTDSSFEVPVQHRRLSPAVKTAVYACYSRLCEALAAGAPTLSMLVLFRECVGALSDLNFIHSVGKDMLDLAVDPDDLFAALRATDPLVHSALLRLCALPAPAAPETLFPVVDESSFPPT